MDKQTLGAIVSITLVLVPVIAISYMMTANDPKVKAMGFFGLSAFLVIAAFGCFIMAFTGENRAGYLWMAPAAYGSFWAWNKAQAFRKI